MALPPKVKNEIESLLRDYPLLKQLAEERPQDYALRHLGRKLTKDYIKAATHADTTQKAVMELEGDEEYQQSCAIVRAIEDVMEFLPDRHTDLVRRRYFKNEPWMVTCRALNCSTTVYYRLRDEALGRFAVRMGLSEPMIG